MLAMPFTHISLPSIGSWPSKTKSSPSRSRQASVDLTKVSEDFGVPQADDPDPFGVLALQRAGLLIKEAGTKVRPTSDTFEFKPSPSSPVFRYSSNFSDTASRASRRDSKQSICSNDAGTQNADGAAVESPTIDNPAYLSPTQLASATIPSPIFERTQAEAFNTGTSQRNSREGNTSPVSPLSSSAKRASPLRQSLTPEPEGKTDNVADEEASKAATAKAEAAAERKRLRSMSASQRLAESLDKLERSIPNSATASPVGSPSPEDSDAEEVIIEQIVTAPTQTVRVMTPKVVSPTAVRAKLVTIKGKAPPTIPARNPRRQRPRAVQAENEGEHLSIDGQDESSSAYSLSPTQSAFDRNDDDHASIPWSEQTSIADMDRASTKSLRATPEPTETADAALSSDAVENKGPVFEKASARAADVKKDTENHGLGIKGASVVSSDEASTEISYVPSAAAHTSPTRVAHLETPAGNEHDNGDVTPTAPELTEPLNTSTTTNAPSTDKPAPDTVSVSDYGHDDTQSQYADDEADEHASRIKEADSNAAAEDDDSEAFHSIPATPVRKASPLDPEAKASPLRIITNGSAA